MSITMYVPQGAEVAAKAFPTSAAVREPFVAFDVEALTVIVSPAQARNLAALLLASADTAEVVPEDEPEQDDEPMTREAYAENIGRPWR